MKIVWLMSSPRSLDNCAANEVGGSLRVAKRCLAHTRTHATSANVKIA